MTRNRFENWSAGDTYEQFMGKWSSDVALRFLTWLDVPPGQCWLDVGCGTGALTRNIVSVASPELVIGLEPSSSFAQFAAQQIEQADFVVADGLSLALADQTFDAVVSGLALNFHAATTNRFIGYATCHKTRWNSCCLRLGLCGQNGIPAIFLGCCC